MSSLSDQVQELSGVDSQQRVDDMITPSSPTLDLPTLPPALKPSDNSASDPIQNPFTKDQKCIIAVNTSPSFTQEHILTSPPVPANKLLSDYGQESPTDNRQCINATNTLSPSTQEHVPTSQSSHLRILNPPRKIAADNSGLTVLLD